MEIFRRKLYERLVAWKESSHGKTALLIEGPRRVGKSTIAQQFGKQEYGQYLFIDFARVGPQTRDLFADTSDLDYIFLQLQLQFGVQLVERDTLIIFDEVQYCPAARQAIKWLVADGRYDYLETGSLISIRKNVADILIPSEERMIQMHPMDFEEFLWATGDDATFPALRQLFEARRAGGDAVHRTLMRKFRLYMLVGGMPQAVLAYLDTNNLAAVDDIKRDILHLYDEDLGKLSDPAQAQVLFNAIPAQLAKNVSRFTPAAETDRAVVRELVNSRTVAVCFHANEPGPGLAASVDLTKFKLFLADTGLFVTAAFRDRSFTDNDLYRRLLADKSQANLGYVYENAVAQMLVAGGHELYYHTMSDAKSKRSYEVDFLISAGEKVIPIEVKSSGYKAHASLDEFVARHSRHIARRIVLHTKDFSSEGMVDYLPVYLAPFL